MPVDVGIPERSMEQRMDALRRANAIREYRKDVKAELKHWKRGVADTIEQPEAELETMRVLDLLLAAPKVGRVKASRILNRCRISPSKTLGGLSERQRRELAAVLRGSPVVTPRLPWVRPR